MDPEIRQFEATLRGPEADLDLGRAALLIARLEHPGLDPAPWLDRLDDLAERSGARRASSTGAALDRLRGFLFETEGFRGNAAEYFDPRNSCLNDVLDRRLGIPITLSVVTMEVGRRVGLTIEGVGLPGHFMVRVADGGEGLLVDPFHGGDVLTPHGAAAVVGNALGRQVALTETHFAAVTKRQIAIRMLMNLRGIYVDREAWAKARAVIERLLVADPRNPIHVRDRGTVLMKLGDFHHGAADWDRYLTEHPDARDGERLRAQLRKIRQTLAALN